MPTPFLNFQGIKERVPILTVANYLNLALSPPKGTEYRCECPVHGGKRSLVINTAVHDKKDDMPGVFNCLTGKEGGDGIDLVAHIRQGRYYAAAKELQDAFPEAKRELPKEETPVERRGFAPPDYLVYDAEAVRAMGVSPETARALGIAFWPRGYHKKRVAFCLRTEDGTPAGWVSIPEALVAEVLLPPDWKL